MAKIKKLAISYIILNKYNQLHTNAFSLFQPKNPDSNPKVQNFFDDLDPNLVQNLQNLQNTKINSEKLLIIDQTEAKNVLSVSRQKRSNNKLFEEWSSGDFERECVEEQCSYEELKECKIHDNDGKKLDKIWRGLIDKCRTSKVKCYPSGTKVCINRWNQMECRCKKGYVGEYCTEKVQPPTTSTTTTTTTTESPEIIISTQKAIEEAVQNQNNQINEKPNISQNFNEITKSQPKIKPTFPELEPNYNLKIPENEKILPDEINNNGNSFDNQINQKDDKDDKISLLGNDYYSDHRMDYEDIMQKIQENLRQKLQYNDYDPSLPVGSVVSEVDIPEIRRVEEDDFGLGVWVIFEYFWKWCS